MLVTKKQQRWKKKSRRKLDVTVSYGVYHGSPRHTVRSRSPTREVKRA